MANKPVTVFPRQAQHAAAPPVLLTGPKVASAIGHVCIGPLIYMLLQANVGVRFWQALGSRIGYEFDTQAVEGDRLDFLVLFATIYGLRWGVLGAFTTNAGNPMPWNATIQVVILHNMLYVLTLTIFSTVGGGLPASINKYDYFAGTLSLLAGILQHGSELQRLIFKRDPSNKGKLHTTGLFGYARFINHTGHFLQDVALAIATRSIGMFCFALMGIPLLAFGITPETEAHMQTKYKEKYEQYCKATPYKFIPFVW